MVNWINPGKQLVWQEIRFFESYDCLKQIAGERLGFSMPKIQAEEASACLQPAQDYYNRADEASITIKPLSLYYGMNNLVKHWCYSMLAKNETD